MGIKTNDHQILPRYRIEHHNTELKTFRHIIGSHELDLTRTRK